MICHHSRPGTATRELYRPNGQGEGHELAASGHIRGFFGQWKLLCPWGCSMSETADSGKLRLMKMAGMPPLGVRGA